MAKHKRMTEDDWDAASADMEAAEVAGREEAVRALAREMAPLIGEAWRFLTGCRFHATPDHVFADLIHDRPGGKELVGRLGAMMDRIEEADS